ncbi:MAG: hypothetical protein AB9828_00740 [Sphaerochaetaceae bacterium]
MQTLRIQPVEQLDSASWFPFSDEPVLMGSWLFPRLRDPVFLFPEESPDRKWHLFANSWLGIQHFVSDSGILWEPLNMVQVMGHSPFLLKEKGTYYLLYERHGLSVPFMERWNKISRKNRIASSHIEMRSSNDLIVWSEPRILIDSRDVPQAADYLDKPLISYPQMIATANGYRLYFGASRVTLKDTRHHCSRYLCSAFSPSLTGPYVLDPPVPMMEPVPNDPWRSLGCGRFSVLQGANGFAAFQTGAYWDSQRKASATAITLLFSDDGLDWKASEHPPILVPATKGWASRYINACDIRYKADEGCWYCYFSASGEHLFGLQRESIGLLIGKDPILRKPVEFEGGLFNPQ